jgi:hypothetical protein
VIKHEYVNCPVCNHRHLKQAIHCPNCLKNTPKSAVWITMAFLVCAAGLVVYIPFYLFGSDETDESKLSTVTAQINERYIARVQAERVEERRESGFIQRRAGLMDDVIGRWCDEMIKNLPNYNYVISIAGIEEPHVIFDFADGSVKIDPLEIRNPDKPNIYSMIESLSGEKFEINTTGSLDISDDKGPIRTASTLEEATKNGTCTK